MTQVLKPYLPQERDETVLSWVARLAAFHTGDIVARFLNDFSIPFQRLLAGDNEVLRNLAEITGADFAGLRALQPEQTDQRRYRFRGNDCSSEFMPQKELAYCPRCLREDDERGHSTRVGRWMWLFEPVRVCEHHNVPLIVHHKTKWNDMIRGFNEIAPEKSAIARQADNMPEWSVSPLQRYVVDRMRGETGPAWLDSQSIEQASRATTIIGVLEGWGASANLHTLADDDWNKAGQLGFEVTSGGVSGIRQFFERIQRNHPSPNANVGPQAVFGPLYKWLQFSRGGKDYGPIKDVLREHILDTMAVKEGSNLLGEIVPETRRHTVKSLAKKSGLNMRTLRRALVSNGLLNADDKSSLNSSVDAVAGEQLAEALSRAITFRDIPEYMNATRGQVETLLQEGFLQPIVNPSGGNRRFSSWVDTREIDDLIARVSDRAKSVDKPTSGMLRIPDAAQASKRPTKDIVGLLFKGRLSTVEKVSTEPGYLSLRVNPVEVEEALPLPQADTRPGRYQAAKLMGLSSRTMKRLLETPGQDFFHPEVRKEGAGAKECFSFEEMERFKRKYVTLGELKKRSGWHHADVLKELRMHGIHPVCDPKWFCAYLFEREQVAPVIL